MGHTLDLVEAEGRPLVMGILNITPDSFYPDSRTPDVKAALEEAQSMVDHGAHILDVGGESTRPGSQPVPANEELERVLAVVEAIDDHLDAPISIDTHKANVAEACLEAGATIVNDISAARDDDRMHQVVADHGADLVLMHMQGRPKTMQQDPYYENVVAQVTDFLVTQASQAEAAGVPRDAIVIDPGIGFGKRLQDNLALLRATATLSELGYPLLVGASRKSMFEGLLGRELDQRLAGSLAVAAYCATQGAHVLRVHDVRETVDAVAVVQAIEEAPA